MTLHVTKAESEILAALWRAGPLSATRLLEEVKARNAWGDATVKTLLGRLMRKGAVLSQREDGRQLYRPAVTREAYVLGEAQALANRLYGGDLAALLAVLAEREGAG